MSVARVWMEIESQLSSVRLACAAIRALCRELGGSAWDADALELALAEALNTVIEHVYLGEAGHCVLIEFSVDARLLTIRVQDGALPGIGQGLLQVGPNLLTFTRLLGARAEAA